MINAMNEEHFDALKEIVNTGVGKAASSLNDMLDSHIRLEVPAIRIVSVQTLQQEETTLGGGQLACVQLGFRGEFSGTAALVFPPLSAVKLVTALTGEEPGTPGMNAVMAGTLNEVGNIVINGVVGTIANYLMHPLDYTVPNYLEGDLLALLQPNEGTLDEMTILMVNTYFWVETLQIEGNVFLFFELGSFDLLVRAIDRIMEG